MEAMMAKFVKLPDEHGEFIVNPDTAKLLFNVAAYRNAQRVFGETHVAYALLDPDNVAERFN